MTSDVTRAIEARATPRGDARVRARGCGRAAADPFETTRAMRDKK